jgi:hypothetical protein
MAKVYITYGPGEVPSTSDEEIPAFSKGYVEHLIGKCEAEFKELTKTQDKEILELYRKTASLNEQIEFLRKELLTKDTKPND